VDQTRSKPDKHGGGRLVRLIVKIYNPFGELGILSDGKKSRTSGTKVYETKLEN
jgi:hypothetical protein